MLILVMGKNGSGKSDFAEKLAVSLRQKRYYIATMLPFGEEGMSRVEKHIAKRAGMGFITLELPNTVGSANIPPDSAALLEDVSNLLSNAMFGKGLSESEVLVDITKLCRRAGCVIAVTISEFSYSDLSRETLRYIRALKWLNRRLESFADAVVEMRDGSPIFKKGEPNEFF